MTHDNVTPVFEPDPDEQARWHDAVGAYILGALPEAERIAFEDHLRDCSACQQELRALSPIATLLPRLYDSLDLPELGSALADLEPSPKIRDRIVAATAATVIVSESIEPPAVELVAEPASIAAVDQSVADTVPGIEEPVVPDIASPAGEAAADEKATEVAAVGSAKAEPKPKPKPRGRIAPGEAPPEAKVVSLPRERKTLLPWAIAAAAAILAIGAILWALAMMGQIDDLQAERDVQDQQLAQLDQDRQEYLANTPALVYPLVSTTASDNAATGMIYMDPNPDGWGGIVAFRGMSQPPSGQVYQLWMITGGQVTPGPTFMPDAGGQAVVQIGGDAAGAGQMAVTMEPSGGSQTPTTSPIMQGNLTA